MFRSIGRTLLRLAGPGLGAFVLSLVAFASSAQAASIHITGTLTNPTGGGVQNVSVTATAPGDSTVVYGPSFSLANGSYGLDVDPGTYDIHFTPPGGSYLNPVVYNNFTVMTDQVLSVQFTAITRTFSGTVRTSANQPLPNVALFIPGVGAEVTTNATGRFSLQLTPGQYDVVLTPRGNTGLGSSIGFNLRTNNHPYDLTAANLEQDIVLSLVPLDVTVQNTAGQPVASVPVTAKAASGAISFSPSGSPRDVPLGGLGSFSNRVFTDANGVAHFLVPDGVEYRQTDGPLFEQDNICATSNGTVFCLNQVVAVSGATSVTLVEPLTYTLSGVVRTDAGQLLPNVTVFIPGTTREVKTNAAGQYSVRLLPNTYDVAIVPGGNTGLGTSIGFNLRTTGRPYDLTAGNLVQDIVLTLANLDVTVYNAAGQIVPSTPVTMSAQSGAISFSSTGSPRNVPMGGLSSFSNRVFTDTAGVAHFKALVGSGYGLSNGPLIPSDNICATIPNAATVCLTQALTINGNTAVSLGQPLTRTFAGKVRTNAGLALAGARIYVTGTSTETQTDAQGNFVLHLLPGAYDMVVQSGSSTSLGVATAFSFRTSGQPYNLTAADLTQDIVLTMADINVMVKDDTGVPVNNANVAATSEGGTIAFLPDGSAPASTGYFRTQARTGADGRASFVAPVGVRYGLANGPLMSDDNICVTLPDLSNVCLAAPLSIVGTTDLLFQPEQVAPVAPQNLSAVTPTNNFPALTWDAVPRAAVYRVFRDGVQISQTPTPNFVDTQVTESAEYQYTVRAVNANDLVSPDSAPFTVVYDITPPEVMMPDFQTPGGTGASFMSIGQAANVHTLATDELSGVVQAEYYESQTLAPPAGYGYGGPDPGQGNGVAMSLNTAGDAIAPVPDNANPGAHGVFVRAKDAAGNWSVSRQQFYFVRMPAPANLHSNSPAHTVTLSWDPLAVAVREYRVIVNQGLPTEQVFYVNEPTYTDDEGRLEGAVTVAVSAFGIDGTPGDLSAPLSVVEDRTLPNVNNQRIESASGSSQISIGETATILAEVTDDLSGVVAAEFYVGADPGAGNGTSMTLTGGQISAPVPDNATPGAYPVWIRAQDAAGNWSEQVAVEYVVKLPAPAQLEANSPTNHIQLSWNAVPDAASYQVRVYRGSAPTGTPIEITVNQEQYDTADPALEGPLTFEVRAVSTVGHVGDVSAPLTVLLDVTAPTIVATVAPAPNPAGWHRMPVTISFTCTDEAGGSGIASCTAPVTINADGNNQNVPGTAIDAAGNSAGTSKTIKYDATAPEVLSVTLTPDTVPVGQAFALHAPATDNLSGVAGGEYYLDTDPGQGNGLPLAYANGELSATSISTGTGGLNLQPGVYLVNVRSRDIAGTWGAPASAYLVVYDPSGLKMKGKKDRLIPHYNINPALSDLLPGLIGPSQDDVVKFAFLAEYNNGTINQNKSDFKLEYHTGTKCNKPDQAANCHDLVLNATSIAWLVVNGTNNSHGIFQGLATVKVDGVTTTNPFRVEGIDSDRLGGSAQDHVVVKVFAPGANPDTAQPLYRIDNDLTRGDIKIF